MAVRITPPPRVAPLTSMVPLIMSVSEFAEILTVPPLPELPFV